MLGHSAHEDDRVVPIFCGGGGDGDDDDDDGCEHGDYTADGDADSSDTDSGDSG